jgi:hypothetical protein
LRYREFSLQTLSDAREQQEEERKHLLDLAATYQRAADAMALGSGASGARWHFRAKAYARKQTTDLASALPKSKN